MFNKISRYIITVAALTAATVTSFAQPEHNDTLRTRTWSIYVQGGVGGFHGMRGTENQYNLSRYYLAPSVDFGVMYYPRPWLRFGLDGGWTYLKTADRAILTDVQTFQDVEIDGYTGDRRIDMARIQNKNFTNCAMADLIMGINFLEIWRSRKAQWINLWLSTGAGYMHGWNKYTYSWAIDDNIISNGPEHFNLYTHSYVESESLDNQFDTFYIPFGIALEFDIIPQLSLGLYGKYKYFPLDVKNSPTGMWNAGLSISYNIVGRKQGFKTKSDRISSLESDLAAMKTELETRDRQNEALMNELSEMKSKPVITQDVKEETFKSALAEIPEVDEPLGKFAVQIMAFKRYQHASNDPIFYGDNPVIYKNGNLRRYVLFTDTLEDAKAKLEKVRKKYPDAFVVKIGDDGIVKPYK